jgi:hypothetical protein
MKHMENNKMLLTKKLLNHLLQIGRIQIPAELESELVEEYGHIIATEDGRLLEYSEQDICEQLRKRLPSNENVDREVESVMLV